MSTVPTKAKTVQKISTRCGNRRSERQYQKMMRIGIRYSRTVAVGALLYLMAAKYPYCVQIIPSIPKTRIRIRSFLFCQIDQMPVCPVNEKIKRSSTPADSSRQKVSHSGEMSRFTSRYCPAIPLAPQQSAPSAHCRMPLIRVFNGSLRWENSVKENDLAVARNDDTRKSLIPSHQLPVTSH